MNTIDIFMFATLLLAYGFTIWKIISKHIEDMDLSKQKICGLIIAIISLFVSAFLFLGLTVFYASITATWDTMQANPRSLMSLLIGCSFFLLPIWVMCTLITKDFIINTLSWMEAIHKTFHKIMIDPFKWICQYIKKILKPR